MMYEIMDNNIAFAVAGDIHKHFRRFLDPSRGDEVDQKYNAARYKSFREIGMVVWSSFAFGRGRWQRVSRPGRLVKSNLLG